MYSLLIDTHDENVICIIFKDGKVINKKEIKSNMRHSEITMPALIELINEEGIKISDISDIIVNIGPGSFTGVRIGVVIAKTMAYLLNKPIRSINSLEMLVYSREELKNGLYKVDEKNGYFVGSFDENGNLINEIEYYSFDDFNTQFKNKEFVNVDKLDFNNIYQNVIKKKPINPHLVNPLYVKKIEVLK